MNEQVSKMKRDQREAFLENRDAISEGRQKEAALLCSGFLKEKLRATRYVSSFASVNSEISLWDLNLLLCSWGKLVLPRRQDYHLDLYHVEDIERDLVVGFKNIMEPNPDRCTKADIDTVDAILVPGLAFDSQNNRIGYGMGLYDRLLAPLDEKLKIGVCYKEQLVKELPTDQHDVPVDIVYSF